MYVRKTWNPHLLFSPCMKTATVSVYGIFKKKFSTRAEPSILKTSVSQANGALEVFGDEVAFVAYGFASAFREDLEKGVLATWKFLNTGDAVSIDSADLNITLDYPEAEDVSFYTHIVKAHVNSEAVLCIVDEVSGDVLHTFPAILCREMDCVSNVLAVCNPLEEPRFLPGYPIDGVYTTSSPRICLQVFPLPLDAYKACCRMQQETRKLKSARISLLGGLSRFPQDLVAYSYQRPVLLTRETAEKLRVSKTFQDLKEVDLLPDHLCIPTIADIFLFQTMWQRR